LETGNQVEKQSPRVPPPTNRAAIPRGTLIGMAFVVAYFVMLGYPPLRIAALIAPAWSPGSVALAMVFCGPAVGWLLHQKWRNVFTRSVLRITYTWVGMGFLAFCIVSMWDLMAFVAALFDRSFGASGVITLLTGVIAYALLNAHRIVVRRVHIDTDKVSESVRIVQLSDVHLGSRTPAFLKRIVRRTNRLRPDIVLITGDLVDLRGLPKKVYEPLAELQVPTYFAIGNHERYIGADEVCAALAEHGIVSLRNQAVALDQLQIIGVDDAEARDEVARVLPSVEIDAERFSVLMYHRPDGLEAAAEAGLDLMLSGHTHNGQIYPFNLLVRSQFSRICGRYQHGDTTLYVSPGTGTWGPVMRLGSANEVTLIELSAR
jgi:predicted MPP superfamily phosphohydrolase